MPTTKKIAEDMRYHTLYGEFPPTVNECEDCRKEVSLHSRVTFKSDRLAYMKTLCIDCAAQECLFVLAVSKGKIDDVTGDKYYTAPTGRGYKACVHAVNRAEKTKKYTARA